MKRAASVDLKPEICNLKLRSVSESLIINNEFPTFTTSGNTRAAEARAMFLCVLCGLLFALFAVKSC